MILNNMKEILERNNFFIIGMVLMGCGRNLIYVGIGIVMMVIWFYFSLKSQ